jgi:hypothetical protein
MILLQTKPELFFETDLFNGIKAVIEIIYLLVAPIIAYFAFKGLEQIKIHKKESKLNSKRKAYKITAEICKDYGERIIPLINKLNDKIISENILFFKESRTKIDNNELTAEYGKVDFDKCTGELSETLNALESFSLYIINGLAEEKIAYNSFGRTFLGTVEKFSPFLILVNKKNYYNNILELFIIWNTRKEKETLMMEKEKLEKKINSKQTITIKHLGEE